MRHSKSSIVVLLNRLLRYVIRLFLTPEKDTFEILIISMLSLRIGIRRKLPSVCTHTAHEGELRGSYFLVKIRKKLLRLSQNWSDGSSKASKSKKSPPSTPRSGRYTTYSTGQYWSCTSTYHPLLKVLPSVQKFVLYRLA